MTEPWGGSWFVDTVVAGADRRGTDERVTLGDQIAMMRPPPTRTAADLESIVYPDARC
jgi:hypothetical protein